MILYRINSEFRRDSPASGKPITRVHRDRSQICWIAATFVAVFTVGAQGFAPLRMIRVKIDAFRAVKTFSSPRDRRGVSSQCSSQRWLRRRTEGLPVWGERTTGLISSARRKFLHQIRTGQNPRRRAQSRCADRSSGLWGRRFRRGEPTVAARLCELRAPPRRRSRRTASDRLSRSA